MARTGGEKTKASILAAAARLFGANGFSETSVDDVAKAAKVNKALIYYYFKNKEELAVTLFRSVRNGMSADAEGGAQQSDAPLADVVGSQIDLLEKKKDIIALLLTESLHKGPASDFLFETCEAMAAKWLKGKSGASPKARNKRLTREFYTGMLPYMMFLILKDKWCAYFKCTPEQVKADFVEVFLASHIEKDGTGK